MQNKKIKNKRSIYKGKESVAIFLCINCYGFAIVMMGNVWLYVTQLFGHIMSPKSLNMACCTYGLNQFFFRAVIPFIRPWHLVKNDKMCN